MVDIMTHLHDYVPKANTPSDAEKLLTVPFCGDQLHVHKSVSERTKCLRDEVAQLFDRYVLLSDMSTLVQSAESRSEEQKQAESVPSRVCNLKETAKGAHGQSSSAKNCH